MISSIDENHEYFTKEFDPKKKNKKKKVEPQIDLDNDDGFWDNMPKAKYPVKKSAKCILFNNDEVAPGESLDKFNKNIASIRKKMINDKLSEVEKRAN